MLKIEVPALTFPVRSATEFVAVIPVPASPSGAAKTAPACKVPSGSSQAAPSLVRLPASTPAERTFGSKSSSFQEYFPSTRALNFEIIFLLKPPVFSSIGNIPEASPTPITFCPVSFQCAYPARVVKNARLLTCSSLFKIAW